MKPRVLIIDGYEGFRRAMEYCLAKDGFEVAAAESVMAALPMVREQAVDVVLLDAMRSFEDGLSECRALKSRQEFAGAAVVLLVDRVTLRQLDRARVAGAHTVMPKVFEWQELLRRVGRLAQAAKAHSEKQTG